MEIKYNVGDNISVNTQKEVKERVDCDICEGVGKVSIKNSLFVCPNCLGKKMVSQTVSKTVAEHKVITSITIGKTGVKYQTKDVGGGNSRSCIEDDIIGIFEEEAVDMYGAMK